jgi:hypothetical protein
LPSDTRPLAVDFYQLVSDDQLATHRTDGRGWQLEWASPKREWMDRSSAYRCLPLTIANQLGLWITNPVSFTATWLGEPDTMQFDFEGDPGPWRDMISSHFGRGIITWNSPYLIRTRPRGSRLLVAGPTNRFKLNCQPMTALMETDWMVSSFTMNWQVLRPHFPVRFSAGEPILQAIPLAGDLCAAMESSELSVHRASDDPDVLREYEAWSASRRAFHQAQSDGGVAPQDWQKHYFQGTDMEGRRTANPHHTRIVPPPIVDGRADRRKGPDPE